MPSMVAQDGAVISTKKHTDDAEAAQSPPKGAGFGFMYWVMARIGYHCTQHFFRRVQVVGGKDVPAEGPFILCCTHFSTLMDVAVISAFLPHYRPIHYWAKRGLYKRQPFRWILENSGNIQVNRKEKSNEALFAGTFEALKAGEAIGLFPEGGSYTEHRLHSMKAGAAWAALEYAKHLHNLSDEVDQAARRPILIVPAAINYTDKSRFRSEVLFEFGDTFRVDEYIDEFLRTSSEDEIGSAVTNILLSDNAPPTPGPSVIVNGEQGPHPATRMRLGLDVGSTSGDDLQSTKGVASGSETNDEHKASLASGRSRIHEQQKTSLIERVPKPSSARTTSARAAVSRLTDRIGAEIYKMTIDAPDWTTWHAVKMARELIWCRGGTLPLENIVPISNALVAILNAPMPEARAANESLCALQGVFLASSTDVYTLNVISRGIRSSRRTNSQVPLSSSTVDEPYTLPNRKQARAMLPKLLPATLFLLRQLLSLLLRLPYVVPLAAVYVPAYFIGWALSLRYASHEEESMASAKSLCAFVIAFLTHAGLVTTVAALFLFTPPGWIVGLCISYAIETLHVWLLDETYDCIKSLVAAWRLFLAVIGNNLGRKIPGASFISSQLGAEDRAVELAYAVVKSQPGVHWTFIKALRNNRAQRNPRRQQLHMKSPNRPQSLQRLIERPACFRVMGATLAVHSQAQYALSSLLKEMEHAVDAREQYASVPDSVLEKYRYLRDQMRSSQASLVP